MPTVVSTGLAVVFVLGMVAMLCMASVKVFTNRLRDYSSVFLGAVVLVGAALMGGLIIYGAVTANDELITKPAGEATGWSHYTSRVKAAVEPGVVTSENNQIVTVWQDQPYPSNEPFHYSCPPSRHAYKYSCTVDDMEVTYELPGPSIRRWLTLSIGMLLLMLAGQMVQYVGTLYGLNRIRRAISPKPAPVND